MWHHFSGWLLHVYVSGIHQAAAEGNVDWTDWQRDRRSLEMGGWDSTDGKVSTLKINQIK